MKRLPIFLALALAACEEPGAAPDAPPSAPVTIAGSADWITSVVPFEDVLMVTAQIDGTLGDPNYVFRVGSALQDLAGSIQAGAADAPANAAELDFSVSSGAVDRLGNTRMVQVMRLTLPMADLRAAQLDNLSVGRLLNLATDMTFTSQGAQQLAAYCASERGRAQSQAFCALADQKAA